jgi:hypothetical protein
MPVTTFYLLARSIGYRERARAARELAKSSPLDAHRLADLADVLERKAVLAEQRAWSMENRAG